MNERILELAEQCYNLPDTPEALYYRRFDKQKFAELIINECAVIADMGWAAPGTQIKQHFGVEQ